jgi:hypothetical protein
MIDDKILIRARETCSDKVNPCVECWQKSIKAVLLEALPKKREHLLDCTYKKRYGHGCNCGAEEHNLCLFQITAILKGEK